jgi:hypothetical protein
MADPTFLDDAAGALAAYDMAECGYDLFEGIPAYARGAGAVVLRVVVERMKETASGMRDIKYGDDADKWWHRVRQAEALDAVAELVAEGLPADTAAESARGDSSA